ncbi:MAG: sulfotransferase [Planctomycetota bacterium]|nr:sulfotransferase [Planctomycetota bacterium]
MNQPNASNLSGILRPIAVPPSSSEPIFVLGSVRSGTSAIGQALTRGAGIAGHDEGHVTTLLQVALSSVDKVVGNYPSAGGSYLIQSFDAAGFKTHIRNYFAAFFAQHCPAGRWADKSPDDFEGAPAIRAAPVLLEMFPKARFVYCQRRGIENVLSRVSKFPHVPFWYHCRSWATTVSAWHETRAKLGSSWIEVRQERMALEPAKVATELAQFLGLNETQRAGLQQSLANDRPEQSRPAGEARSLTMADAGWDPGLQGVFLQECTDAMKLAGYSFEGGSHGEDLVRLFWASAESSASTTLRGLSHDMHRALNRDDFVLGPPAAGARAELIYHDLAIRTRRSFRARLATQGDPGLVVEYSVEVRDGNGRVIASGKARAAAGAPEVPLAISLPAGDNEVVSVTISTQAVQGKVNANSIAEWRSPAFHP